MEHLDYLPFLQFIRDDKETVEIMQKALTIIPKVCDFLDGNLEAFNPRSGPSSSSLTAEGTSLFNLPSTSENRLTSIPGSSGGSLTLSRKRKQPVREIPSESSSVAHTNPSTCSLLPVPKKARVLIPHKSETQITPPSRRQRQSELPTITQIRERLQEDYDKFVRQIGELAALEREKNRLLGKFLSVSAIASGSASSESSTSESSTSED